jgi:hypothetical protein
MRRRLPPRLVVADERVCPTVRKSCEGTPIRIGQSRNIRVRVAAHRTDKAADDVQCCAGRRMPQQFARRGRPARTK